MRRNKIVENRWVTMLQDEYQLPNGTNIQYYHVQRTDAVMSIVLDISTTTIVTYIVKQHRHPIGKEIWQFPLGGIDIGKSDYCAAAKLELKEEVGIEASSFEYMGSFYTDPGFTNQKMHVCISRTIGEVGQQNLEGSEYGLICKKICVDEISKYLENGEMGDAWGIVGLHYVRQYIDRLNIDYPL